MEREVDWEREAQNPPAPGRGGKRVARQGQSEPQSPGREMYQNVRTLVTVLAVLILVFTFVARIIVVSGPSMENTLQNGDAMLVWSLGYTPEQGDVVVLTKRSYQEDSIVKRVIATGGQTVDIDYATGTVYVDGVALEEDYIKEQMQVPSYGDMVNHVTVPEGCLFVMGDNRNHSTDSRFLEVGFVEEGEILGRVIFRLLPLDKIGTVH